MIFDEFARKIEAASKSYEQALQYEATLKYRIWNELRKTQIGELEDLYVDANAALKIVHERYQNSFYSKDDFRRIHQHLHQRKNRLRVEMLESQAELDEYKKHYSSESDRIKTLLPFDGTKELSEDMCKLIERCDLIEKNITIGFYENWLVK